MKNRLFVVLFSTILLISTDIMSRDVPFTILHFSDSHSYLLGTGKKNNNLEYTYGGLSRAATIIANTRGTDTNVMVFHSGDIFTGDFFFNRYFSAPEYTILSRLQFDAIAVGNHEFDLGPQVFYNAVKKGFEGNDIPLLSANLDLSGFPLLNEFIYPYIIKDYNGVRVGTFGLTIPDPSSNPYPVVISDSILQKASLTVQMLYSQNCDVVICLSHLGFSFDNTLASIIPGIHIILGGHDHLITYQPAFVENPAGFNTMICHPGEHYKIAGKLKFVFSNGNVLFKSYTPIEIKSDIPHDQRIKDYINSYKEGIITKYGEVYGKEISNAEFDISPEWDEESPFRDTPLGNLITDAYREKTGTQISITARGLMVDKLYEGKVTGNDIFRLTPYGYDTTTGLGFNLETFSIKGIELKRAMELIFAIAPDNLSFFPQFSGLKFDYDKNLPIGGRVLLSSMSVNDTAFSLTKDYSVTVNTGMLSALIKLGIRMNDVTPTFIPEYKSVFNFISNYENLNYVSTGRIRELKVNSIGNGNAGNTGYKLFDNYPNPFNSTTVIKYTLPRDGRVSIKIYDVTGKVLSVPVNQFHRAGEYSLRFNGNNLSTGIYFYRMESGGFIQTRKFVLIK